MLGVVFKDLPYDNPIIDFHGNLLRQLYFVIISPPAVLHESGRLQPSEEVSFDFKTHWILIIYCKFYQNY